MKFGLACNTAYYSSEPDLMAATAQHARASQGVTRLVVGPTSTELAGLQAEISSFASRLGLG